MASRVIMDGGTESTMTKHRRADRRGGMSGLDDAYLPGQHCPGWHRPRQREATEGHNGESSPSARKASGGKRG